jgi:putative tryptophan/tyrosine transport system substrate-binding protein
MDRRELIATLGATAAWPLAARAQQLAVPVVGFLNGSSAWEYARMADAFRQGLSETGYVEGRNVLIDYRWAEGHYDRLPTLAAELVRRQVRLIAANAAAVVAAKAATTSIPIVFQTGVDLVAAGLVVSLNRPGGNLTGVSTLGGELGPKRLEVLRELLPAATSLAVLLNPTGPNVESTLRDLQAAARTLGVALHVLHASTESEFEMAFAIVAQLRAGGLSIGPDGFFFSRSEQLAALGLRHAVPTIFQNREFPAAGGLMSYGASTLDSYRLMGLYAGRILKGEKPADLPVQQATRVELVINMKTAKALGLTFPLTLLGRADEVIE